MLSLPLSFPSPAKAMTDAEHWAMDGTFKSAPNHFTQLFTIHGLFPLLLTATLFYGLLPSSTDSFLERQLPSTATCSTGNARVTN